MTILPRPSPLLPAQIFPAPQRYVVRQGWDKILAPHHGARQGWIRLLDPSHPISPHLDKG